MFLQGINIQNSELYKFDPLKFRKWQNGTKAA